MPSTCDLRVCVWVFAARTAYAENMGELLAGTYIWFLDEPKHHASRIARGERALPDPWACSKDRNSTSKTSKDANEQRAKKPPADPQPSLFA